MHITTDFNQWGFISENDIAFFFAIKEKYFGMFKSR